MGLGLRIDELHRKAQPVARFRYASLDNRAYLQRTHDTVQRHRGLAKRLHAVPRHDLERLDLRELMDEPLGQSGGDVFEPSPLAVVVEVEHRDARRRIRRGGHCFRRTARGELPDQ